MCVQLTAYNTYATLSYTNLLFMGFPGYSKRSQRDNFQIEEKYKNLENHKFSRFFVLCKNCMIKRLNMICSVRLRMLILM